MSPLFGHKDEQKQDPQDAMVQWRRTLQTEFERVNELPLSELATEVMVAGFGPGGPGGDDDAISLGQGNVDAGPIAPQISSALLSGRGLHRAPSNPAAEDLQLLARIEKLVAEGLQELEHASLVRVQMHTAMGYLDWAATRRGRAALQNNEIQKILQPTNDGPSQIQTPTP